MSDTTATPRAPVLSIGVPGFTFADLHDPHRLRDLTEVFDRSLEQSDAPLHARYDRYRTTLGDGMTPQEISAVIIDVAPHVSAFLSELFQVQDEHGRWRRAVELETAVFVFKR